MTVLATAAGSTAIASTRAAGRARVGSALGQPTESAISAGVKAPVREVNSTATRWRRLAFGVIFMLGLLAAAAVAGGSVTNPTCGTNGGVVYDGDLGRILATIRHFESRGDYNVRASKGTASGAYQFLDSSWSNYGGYPSAWLAPPEVQDAKAAEWVTIILTNHPNDVSSVPVTWYIGHVPAGDSAEWDTVPYPQFGNVLTLREYQTRWLTYYNDPTSSETPATDGPTSLEDSTGPTCIGVVGVGDYRIPDGVVRLVGSSISWGGYENGRIPFEAMRYSPNSNYLHPSASAAWDQLHAAALQAGHNLSGNGYRPRSVGGETAGTSNHGWGLAIDVTVLVPGNGYPTRDAAFASDEYQWLMVNAPLYGWLNPDWAKPVSLGGTGTGGWVGDQCCFLEPWHWEWAAFMNQYLPAES